jgi:hypothetical protein
MLSVQVLAYCLNKVSQKMYWLTLVPLLGGSQY